MNNQQEHIDPIEQFFQKRFQGHEEMPSDGVWDVVAAGLEKLPKKGVVVPFWKRTAFYLGLGSVVLLVLAYFYFTQEKETKNIPIQIQKETKGGESVLPEPTKIPIEVKKEIKAKISKIQSESENAVSEKNVPRQEVMQTVGISEEKKVVQEEKEIEHAPEPVEETIVPEPEPPKNLFEKLKKEQKAKKELFIEKKE